MSPATVGWCPGALRPMASGDGLILRVKPRGGRLTLAQAEAIADLSLHFGNGHIDLTGRANLQIRGATPETLDRLTAGLRDAGLLDSDAATEALRNIVASPLAGLDPGCFHVRPFLATLEACLATVPGLHRLPAKWSFVVDGGGRLPLAGVPADMRFRFDRDGTLRVGLGAACSEPLDRLPDLPRLLAGVAALMALQPEPMRMASLLVRHGLAAVFARLDLPFRDRPIADPIPHPHAEEARRAVSKHGPGLRRLPILRDARVPRALSASFSNALRAFEPQAGSARDEGDAAEADTTASDLFRPSGGVVGFAPPFGALHAETLHAALKACRTAGGDDLRLTPWRVLLAAGIEDEDALSAALARLDLIVDAGDPRLTVSACVGAPACHRATTATRADAALLASRLGGDLRVHVAGCAKACGRPTAALWTLVAHEGRYDLLRDGEAAPHAAGLSSTEAANWLSRAGRARIS